MLREDVLKKVNEIETELEKNNGSLSEDFLNDILSFINSVDTDIDSLAGYDTGLYVDTVFSGNNVDEIDTAKNELNNICGLIKLKKVSDNPYFKLTDEQKMLVDSFISKTKEFVEIAKKNYISPIEKNNKEVLKRNLQIILDKMDRKEGLSENDFVIIDQMIKEYEGKDKFEIYKEIIKYNVLMAGNNSLLTKNVDINKVVEKIDKIPVSNLKEEFELREDEVGIRYDENNIDEIISFMQEKDILYKFDPVDLGAILCYGNKESVLSAYNKLNELNIEKKEELDYFYHCCSFWVVQKDKNEGSKVVSNTRRKSASKGGASSFESLAYRNSRDDMIDIYYILKDIEKSNNVNINKGKSIFADGSPEKVRANFELFKHYNICPENSTIYNVSNTLPKIDYLIEIGLLNPTSDLSENEINNYANKKTTVLAHINDDKFLHIRNLFIRKNSFTDSDDLVKYDDLFRITKSGVLVKGALQGSKPVKISDDVLYNLVFEDDDEKIDYMKLYNLVSSENLMVNYDKLYKEVDPNSFMQIDYDIINSDFVKELDTDEDIYVNPFLYQYDGHYISREKVLRLYQQLQNKGLSESDMRLFSLTYNSYFDSNVYRDLMKYVGYENERSLK